MLKGPREFCPTIEMEVVAKRKAIPLDANEGVYIRNVKTGKVFIFFLPFFLFNCHLAILYAVIKNDITFLFV